MMQFRWSKKYTVPGIVEAFWAAELRGARSFGIARSLKTRGTMEAMEHDQLVTVISSLGECGEVELMALWQRLAPGEPEPDASELLRTVQMRLAQRV